MPGATGPIGVFDSGIGGLSVLHALMKALPDEAFVYLADNAHAPYGEKTEAFVRERSSRLARYLIETQGIKALVVACNTATAAAIEAVREAFPALPVVGIEPGLKPAAEHTRTGHIGVMATRGTVQSPRFARLMERVQNDAHFKVQACDGLALAIEQASAPESHGLDPTQAAARVEELLHRYATALGPWGKEPGQTDTLVLGCTHYVFAQEALQRFTGDGVRLLSTGEPVARQTRRLLEAAQALQAPRPGQAQALTAFATGDRAGPQAACRLWLRDMPQAQGSWHTVQV